MGPFPRGTPPSPEHHTRINMAHQLIYTSAPRLLEAGRSGFGTVARHREIPPLMVTALERISQFSRLPGSDTARVVYAHRVLNAGGRSFHVLSAIRDAGADYTGRTNHIAHHLVVDPREIAALGTACPSPAEVLQAMEWATAWQGNPMFLDGSHQVDLAALRLAPQDSAWERLTGQADQAWLLASLGTNRGISLLYPSACDLREIYNESLRLVPERLWQIPFTTSLQPSDETSDFRWTGIEEHSALRSHLESSGRLILNLADPETLPLAEKPKQKPISAPSPVSTIDVPGVDRGISAEPNPAAAFLPNTLAQNSEGSRTLARVQTNFSAPARNGEAWEDLEARSSRKFPKRSGGGAWKLVGAAVLLLGVFLGIRELQNRKYQEGIFHALDQQQAEEGYFQSASLDIQKQITLLGSRVIPSAQALLEDATQAVRLVRKGEIEKAQEALQRARDKTAMGLNIPPEVNVLEDHLKAFQEFKEKIVSLEKAEKFTDSQRVFQALGDELKNLLKSVRVDGRSDIFKPLGNSFKGQLQEKKIEIAYNFIIKGANSPEEAEVVDVKRVLEELKNSFKDQDITKKKMDSIKGVLTAREQISKAQSSSGLPAEEKEWPSWLKDARKSEKARLDMAKAEALPSHESGDSKTASSDSSVPPQFKTASDPAQTSNAKRPLIYILNGVEEFQKGVEIEVLNDAPELYYAPISGGRYKPLYSVGTNFGFDVQKYWIFLAKEKVNGTPQKFNFFLSGNDVFKKDDRIKLISDSFIVWGSSAASGSIEFQIHVKVSGQDSPLWPAENPSEVRITRNGSELTIHPGKISVSGKPIDDDKLSVDIEAGKPCKKLGSVTVQWEKDCRFSVETILVDLNKQLVNSGLRLKEIDDESQASPGRFKKTISGVLEPGTLGAGTCDFFAGKEFQLQRKEFSQALDSVRKKKAPGGVSIYFNRDEESPISFGKVKWDGSVEDIDGFLAVFEEVLTVFKKNLSNDPKKTPKTDTEIGKLERTLKDLKSSTSAQLKREKLNFDSTRELQMEKNGIEEKISKLKGEDVPPWRYKLKLKKPNGEILLLDIDRREEK